MARRRTSLRALANAAVVTARIRARRSRRTRKSRRGRSRLFRQPRPGGSSLVIPMRVGYSYDILGTGAAAVNFDSTIGLNFAPADWFNRYNPIFNYVRINKARIEITCPYNIGQSGVGNQSLYRMWSKKASSTAEVPPDSLTEWLNMQNCKRTTFSGRTNSVNYFLTPGYETTVQPLNTAVTELRLLYKQWQTIQTTPGAMTPHIGVIGQIHRLDGGAISSAHVFKVNVTLYCQVKGIKQL